MIRSSRKLAVFLPALYGGGAERTMLNLAQGIAERGHEVDLVLSQAEGPYLKDVPESVHVVDLGRGRRLKARKTLSRLPALVRYLRSQQPDAMLAALVQSNIMAVCARRLARFSGRVVINEQNTLSCWATNSPSRFRKISPTFAKYFYRWADRVVGVSQGVADDLVNVIGVPADRVQVIHNPGITPDLEKRSKAPLDHPWFREQEPPVALAVGSLTQQKDFETLIRAFAIVRKTRHARLLILGEGRERGRLESLVRQLGLQDDVGMPGFVDNPYAYMTRASTFVLSSRWEGLPTVLVEALYCGVPLVATDCPSGPREILRGGKLGHLVPMSDPGMLARAILETLDGNTPHVTSDSWQPYVLDGIVDKYTELLFGAP